MADKDPEGDGPSLELPSFGFGRKKRRERDRASHPEVPASPDPGPDATPGAAPEVPSGPGSAPEVPVSPDPGPEVVPGAAPEVPAAPTPEAPDTPPGRPEIDPLVPAAPDEPAPGPEIDPLIPAAPQQPAPAPEIDPVVPTRPEWQPPADPQPQPEPDPEPQPEPEPDPLPDPGIETLPDPHDPDPVAPPPPAAPRPGARTAPSAAGGAHDAAASVGTAAAPTTTLEEPVSPAPEPSGGRALGFPTLPALPAVLLVGAVVGLVAVLLTWASLRLCDAATGTASCGGGPGLLMLVAILIALAYLGGWLLRGLGIGDAGSTSVLAVGLLAVVTMLFLVDSLDEWAGAVLVVLVTVAAYALAWRVTAVMVEADRS